MAKRGTSCRFCNFKLIRSASVFVFFSQAECVFLAFFQPAVPYFGIQNLDFSAQGAAAAINIAVENKAATMGGTINFDPSEIPNPGEMVISSTLNLWGFEGVAGNDPIAFVNHPVFETLDKKSKTVGFMTMYIHWRRFFVDILPANAEGVLAVVENTCNETFSFRIDGMEVEYLGPGDHHDSRYNDMEEITHITRDFNERRSRFYSGAPLSDGYCDYSVRVFPSNEMEDAHLTNAPLFYTLGSVAIFFFTSVLFLCYDSYVERRQRIVMRKVTQTGNMLDTIFPEEIRDQLILEQEEPAPKKKSYMSTNHRLQHFLRSDGKDLNTSDANISKVSKPIANLFPHTTVMFADVANFTSWASTRDAAQIFQFLQAIYRFVHPVLVGTSLLYDMLTVSDRPFTVNLMSWQNEETVLKSNPSGIAMVRQPALDRGLVVTDRKSTHFIFSL